MRCEQRVPRVPCQTPERQLERTSHRVKWFLCLKDVTIGGQEQCRDDVETLTAHCRDNVDTEQDDKCLVHESTSKMDESTL